MALKLYSIMADFSLAGARRGRGRGSTRSRGRGRVRVRGRRLENHAESISARKGKYVHDIALTGPHVRRQVHLLRRPPLRADMFRTKNGARRQRSSADCRQVQARSPWGPPRNSGPWDQLRCGRWQRSRHRKPPRSGEGPKSSLEKRFTQVQS
jgi:hypothetical protein